MWELLKKRSANRRKGTLLEERERATERKQRLLAFLLPVLAFYIGFAAHGLWPVGNRHLLAYDLYHQYAPFLLELKGKSSLATRYSFRGRAAWASIFIACLHTTSPAR